jgi:cytochrome c oxidase subunit 3
MAHHGSYYVPEYSKLPFFTALGLFCLGYGSLRFIDGGLIGKIFLGLGAIILAIVLFGWFRETIRENFSGLHDAQMNRSYRWGMFWVIFADFMLFAIILGALLYIRFVSVPDLGGTGILTPNNMTNLLLWPNFTANWPLLVNPSASAFIAPAKAADVWGVPALNTLIVLFSMFTMSRATSALKKNKPQQFNLGLILTVILGAAFLVLQIYDLFVAQHYYGITLESGIYGSTFVMLTGIFLFHVLIAVTILLVILARCLRGHFTAENYFAYEAATWFWQYLAIMWLVIFVLAYWL